MSFSPRAKLGLGIGAITAIGVSGYLIFSEHKLHNTRLTQQINAEQHIDHEQQLSHSPGHSPNSPDLPENKVNNLKVSMSPVNAAPSQGTQETLATPSAPSSPSEPKPSCLTFTFEPQNKDLSQFPRHVLKVPTQSIESASQVCIRINGMPVRYLSSKKNPNEFTIGAILAKNPKVTIRACQKGVKCSEDCTIPKDEFMEALAGEEDLSVAQAVSTGWSETEQDKKIDRELAHFKKDLQGADETKGLFYQDWKVIDQKSACEKTVAKK